MRLTNGLKMSLQRASRRPRVALLAALLRAVRHQIAQLQAHEKRLERLIDG